MMARQRWPGADSSRSAWLSYRYNVPKVQPKPLYGLGIYTLEKSSDGRDVPVAFFPQHAAFREESPCPDGANEGSEPTTSPAPNSDSQAKPGLSKSSGSIQSSNPIATGNDSARPQPRYPPGDDKEPHGHERTSRPASPQAVATSTPAPSLTTLPQSQDQADDGSSQNHPQDGPDCTTPHERQRRPHNKLRKRPGSVTSAASPHDSTSASPSAGEGTREKGGVVRRVLRFLRRFSCL